MPNCFTLTRKSDVKAGAVLFTTIDEEICKHLNKEVHEVYWYCGWYDSIGFMLAMGKRWDDIREIFKESTELLPVIDYLEANFIPDSWAEIGRR